MSAHPDDAKFMRQAVRLAMRGYRTVHPNPPVGAVIVKNGVVVGRGYHREAGGPHAELEALNNAGDSARGATLYVTLEPCNHTGRTGPCADVVLGSGLARVVVGIIDPNPKVTGGGADRLKASGIDVTVGCLHEVVSELCAPWIKWIRTGKPLAVGIMFRALDGRLVPPAAGGAAANARYRRLLQRGRRLAAGGEGDRQIEVLEAPNALAERLERSDLDRLVVFQTNAPSGELSMTGAGTALTLLSMARRGDSVVSVYSVNTPV